MGIVMGIVLEDINFEGKSGIQLFFDYFVL
jgi:hypothetical protein